MWARVVGLVSGEGRVFPSSGPVGAGQFNAVRTRRRVGIWARVARLFSGVGRGFLTNEFCALGATVGVAP